MKVTRPKATISVRKVSRPTTKKQYLGETDPAQYIHSHKTHRSVSEAFRDADYATAIWKCKTDWDRTKEYLGWVLMWAGFLFLMYQSMVGFEKWIGS
jgi:hypothetical protein